MNLPAYVSLCIGALEQKGFAAYAVGGCVRDSVLGLIPHDYDLCTNALPEEIKAVFCNYPLVLAGEKHGTVGVVIQGNVVEITTFRTEGDYRDNRHPDWVRFVPDIKEDLARRDFTVNAMAWSPIRGFADPFGGQEDLKNGILRAVGDPGKRFQEDSLRILRGVRFAVRFGLKPDPKTEKAMTKLAPLMDNLARERVFEELCKLIPLMSAHDLLQYAPVITQVIPELKPTLNFQQHSPHHIYDLYTHIAHTVAAMPNDLTLRWAALLHDLGKPETFTLDERGQGHFYGHAAISAQMADAVLRRLKASNQLRERVVFLIEKHMALPEPDKKFLRRWLSRFGQEPLTQLLSLQRGDAIATGTRENMDDYNRMDTILQELLREDACLTVRDLAIGGRELMELGFSGPNIGKCLKQLLLLVLDETLPNTSDALLRAAEDLK